MADKLERIYTVPLGGAYEVVRNRRAKRAVQLLKDFLRRHMKADGGDVVVSAALNQHIWKSGIQKPPRRVKIRAIKDDGRVSAYLHDEKVSEKKKDAPKEEKKPAEKPKPAEKEKPAEKKPAPEKKEPVKEAKPAEKKAEPKEEKEAGKK